MTDALALDEAPEAKIDTGALMDLLRAKYPRDRYAMFFDVPDAVSLQQRRRIDALAFGIWQTVGREIQGFELKVSRSDWLREVKQVDKADPFVSVCDRFWLVTGDPSIAKLEEVPACWGWMSATKTGLRAQRPASKLPGCGDSIPRNFMLGVLRKMQDDPMSDPSVLQAIKDRSEKTQERIDTEVKYKTTDLRHRLDTAEKVMAEFEKESGIKLMDWRYGNVGEIVMQLRRIGYTSDRDGMADTLKRQEDELRRLAETLASVRQLVTAPSVASLAAGDSNE